MSHPEQSAPSVRLWPGVVAAILLVLLRFVAPALIPEILVPALIGSVACILAILLWWLFFSRAPSVERFGGMAFLIVAMVIASRLLHVSIATGSMGVLYWFSALPFVAVLLVAWAAGTRGASSSVRHISLIVTIAVAAGGWTLLRTEGTSNNLLGSEFHWRWSATPEERLLAHADVQLPPTAPAMPTVAEPIATAAPATSPATTSVAPPMAAAETPSPDRPAWPGFRGASRDSVVTGLQIDTDWVATPPVEIWRQPIGPGWSSFSVEGDLIYTQEQRGDDEVVSCYRLSTGAPVWGHRDPVRFWESNGGAGPRATPTIDRGRVFAFGATGILNALDAATGARLWSANVATDTARDVPTWGFTSSPLVAGDVVIVAAVGTLAAYDIHTGALRWTGPSYGGSYSSPHPATIGGVPQVVMLGGPGAIGVAPADGTVLWTYEWSSGPIVQPAVLPDGDVLVNAIVSTGGIGLRRLRLAPGEVGWTATERWHSNGLKPYFNDFVLHEGHAYGFDGAILSAINLDTGDRVWKGGRYGNGQLLLIADQDLLLVISEEGELALVSATPNGYVEVARMPAIDGKTWNHPVVVGDVLLVRNGREMAAFRLARRR